ncbi:MAG TPA: hypothetical protein VKZ98_05075, partial [Aquaticitalea sp.]|nr:hypothetical protein [Aquaticitalea sp.]
MIDYKSNTALQPANHFEIKGNIQHIERFGSGHINDTFSVKTDHPDKKSYLLQRINHHIFANVDGLMRNTKIVLDHLKSKLAYLGEERVEKATLTLIPTKDGQLYHRDEEGNYWRMFILIQGTKSYDIVRTPAQAYSGGQAFGEFQKQLSDLDANKLVEILPNFHNIDFRINNLKKAIGNDTVGRVKEVQHILDYIFERKD